LVASCFSFSQAADPRGFLSPNFVCNVFGRACGMTGRWQTIFLVHEAAPGTSRHLLAKDPENWEMCFWRFQDDAFGILHCYAAMRS